MEVIDYEFGKSIPQLIGRHAAGMIRGVTPRKAVNALMFLAEKKLHVTRARAKPFYIKIEPTNVCDHACLECPTLTSRPKGFMTFEVYKDIIDYFKPYCLRNCLYGQGESFLHKDIFDMIEYSEQNRCPVSICSNFNNLDQTKLQRLLDSGLNYLIVCIDGATQKTHSWFRRKGSLDKVLENLRTLMRLKEQGGYRFPVVEVQTITTEVNAHERDAIIRLTRDVGVQTQRFRLNCNILNHGGSPGKPEACPYLWGSVFLTWDAKVCCCEVDYIGRDLFIADFAKVKYDGADYWNTDRMRHARSLFDFKRIPAKRMGIRCERCKFYPLPDAEPFEKATEPLDGFDSLPVL
jgi:hypothetical protein